MKVPNFDFSVLVPKNDFYFVGVEHSAVDHDSAIVILPLVTLTFEVKNFDVSIFASCEKPLVLLLKAHGYDIRVHAVEIHILVLVTRPQVEHFHQSKRASAKVPLVTRKHQAVNSVVTKLFGVITLGILNVPKFNLLIVSSCRQDYILLLVHLFYKKIIA